MSRTLWAGIVVALLFVAGSAVVKIVRAPSGAPPVVTMVNLAYVPHVLTVARGTVVTFENHNVSPHTVTADDGSFDSGVLTPGQSFQLVVRASVEFHCRIHPFMTGRIVVL